VPKHKWETAYRNGTFKESLGLQTDPNDVVVCGPYRLKEFTTDQRVVLERNPYYWKVDSEGKRLPYIDRVIILIVPDFNTSTAKFQAGETDMMRQVRPEDMDLLKRSEAEKDFKVYDLGPGLNTVSLAFNQNPGRGASGTPYVDPVKLAWFTNKTFRQAVSYGIDRDGLIKTVFNGLGVPIYSLCSPSNKVWYDDAATKKYPYDPDKARAMLAEIGMTDRDGDGIVEDSKGNPVRFRVETNVENNTRVNVANFIADNLRKIGLQAELDPKPFNQLIVELQDSHSFDAIVLGWQTGVPPDPVQMKNILLSSGRSHQWNPNQKTPATPGEKRVDELILEISRTLDLETRKKLHAELLSVWTDEVWEIELVAANYFVAAKNRFGNFRPSFMPMYTYWNIEELYLTK
jgi:peptide/nickel transport system substrate-binding protein